ncbi:MAG TPA: hypothetical protein VGJ25_03540 [Gaiellaceae bacterium]
MHDAPELPEYAAVLHLLTAPALRPRTAHYLADGELDWTGLLDETRTMSGGESLLVRIAYELWHARKDVGLWEIPRRLDAHNFARVIEALRICREVPADVSPLRLAV